MFFHFLETRWKAGSARQSHIGLSHLLSIFSLFNRICFIQDEMIEWVKDYCYQKDFEEFCEANIHHDETTDVDTKEEGKKENFSLHKEQEGGEEMSMETLSEDELLRMRRLFEDFLNTVPLEEKGPKLKIRGKQHRGTDVLAEKKKRKRNQHTSDKVS
jgi:hypothetical protein